MGKLTTITSPSGARFTVAADYAPKFQALIGDLESAGYGINPKASGGYNPRTIAGTNKPSNHAFGRAIDINWDRNARGTKGDIPAELARMLAAKHGMTWGGDWRNPDAMHFEVANAGPVPLGQRSLTAYAGVSKTQPPTTGTPQPMPNMLDVGGQAPVMDPAEVARRQRLAQVLMQNGQDTGNMRHWTQALGAVLNSGAGVYQGKQAAQGLAQGQQTGNQALAQLLMGGDASAAMSNPYSSEQAIQYQQQQKLLNDRTAAAERLQRSRIEAQNADPKRQLEIENLRSQIEARKGGGVTPGGITKGAPSGYMWNEPGNPSAGIKRIPGFEQTIPGEVAGKVAQMADAKERIKNTRAIFEKDWSAGDAAKWAAGNLPVVGDVAALSGDIGIAQRDVRVGIEAALRTMTGAAAPEQEVQRYMQMYMPTPLDTKESAKQKLDGLMSFMDKAEKIVMQGRGEIAQPSLDGSALQGRGAQPLIDTEGWTDVGGIKIREKR